MVDVLRGVGQGLEAVAAGQRYRMAEEQAEQRRGLHDIAMQQGQIGLRGLERQEKNQKLVDNLSMKATDAWKQQDRNAYRTALGELARVDNQKAVQLDQMWGNLDKSNFVEAAYNLQGSVLVPDDDPEGKNMLLDNAIERIGDPNNPLAHHLNRIKQIPPGEERDRAEMEAIAFAKEMGAFPMQKGRVPSKKQKTGAFTVRDPEGNVRIMAGVFNPDTGELEVKGQALPEGYEMVSKIGETAEELTKRKIGEAGAKKAAEEAVKKGVEFADQYEGVQRSIRTIDEGITLMEDAMKRGERLGVGPFEKYLPKWNEASANLEYIGSKLGLDVVSSVTFGALSEGELRLAMETGMPRNLDDPQLLQWMKDKKEALNKLGTYYAEAAAFIGSMKPDGSGVYTVTDWMKQKQRPTAAAPPPTTQDLTKQSTADLLKAFQGG